MEHCGQWVVRSLTSTDDSYDTMYSPRNSSLKSHSPLLADCAVKDAGRPALIVY